MAYIVLNARWICLCLVFASTLHEGARAAVTDPATGPFISDSKITDNKLELKCIANNLSDPTANITWLQGGPDGTELPFAITSVGDAATGTLKLTATTSFNVSGTGAVAKGTNYTCKVDRSAGTLWQAVTTGDPTTRLLQLAPAREKLYYGDTVVLACPNYGTNSDPDTLPADPLPVPSPLVEWQFNYTDAWTGYLPAGATVQDGVLTITNLGDIHDGEYTCQATNVYYTNYAFKVVQVEMAPSTVAPTTTPNEGNLSNTGAVVGGVIGGLLGAILLGVLAYFGYQHYTKSQKGTTKYSAAASDAV